MEGSSQPPGHGSGDPSHHMPPPPASEQPTSANVPPPGSAPPPGGPPPGGYTIPQVNWPTGARLTIPGNAEWALWFFVEIVFAIIWASSDWVNANDFMLASAIITFAYLISRGIAKASRVLEQ
jgi:hypothetical protein